MCTALNLNTGCHYFGRNLDIDTSYGEEVCVMPRNFPLNFRLAGSFDNHYAMIGMATVVSNLPLLYDAANEYGLAMAGLNFPENAYYSQIKTGYDNIAPFEFIPWVLGQCRTIDEARILLSRINIADIAFSEKLPSSPLHWIISSREGSLVVESMRDGLHIYENETGVLTNNPPFEYQLSALKKYEALRTDNFEIKRDEEGNYSAYCQGLGAVGLPGDVSSMSRFARIVFGLKNSVCRDDELSSVGQFFHLLSSVEMTRGVCKTDNGTLDITLYTSCINTAQGLYYYTTYGNRRISCVDMRRTDLNGKNIARFPLSADESIHYQN